jgi:N-acetylglucosamine-6-phosphate deacetylase
LNPHVVGAGLQRNMWYFGTVNSSQKLTARQIFTGYKWIYNAELVLKEGHIEAILPTSETPRYDLLVPAFIDIQIYGAYGRLFSVFPNCASLNALYRYCQEGGASFFLPTIATNTRQVLSDAIRAVRDYWQQGGKGCLGLHLEGPWLAPQKRGAHVEALLHSPTKHEVDDLLDEGEGIIKLITLAPEICDRELVAYIASRGIKLSLGHSNASFEQATSAFSEHVSLATHLFNAMSPMQHRSPGVVGAILSSDSVMASIIPDGHHVDWSVIQIAKKLMGERLFAITDAVTETDQGPYLHQPVADRFMTQGTLSGSSLNMLRAFNNLIRFCKIDVEEALRMCSLYPARAIGLGEQLGQFSPGLEAHWIALTKKDQLYTLIDHTP